MLISDGEGLLGSLLLGNNLVNIAASMLTGQLFARMLGGEHSVWIATAVMTVLVPSLIHISEPTRPY